MITDSIILLGQSFLSYVIGLLPSSSGFPDSVLSAAEYIGGYLGVVSPLLPIGTLATVITLVLTAELAIFGFKTIRWLLGYVPFIGH